MITIHSNCRLKKIYESNINNNITYKIYSILVMDNVLFKE